MNTNSLISDGSSKTTLGTAKEKGLLENFSEYLAVKHGESTVRCYSSDLRTFIRFFQADPAHAEIQVDALLSQITRADLQRFLSQQEGAPATIRRRMVSLRVFYEWMKDREMVSTNPANGIPLPKVLRIPSRAVSSDQMEKILAAIAARSGEGEDDLLTRYRQARDRTLLMLLFNSGAPLRQFLSLNLEDLKIANEAFQIKLKGETERLSSRTVECDGKCAAMVRDYLKIREAFAKSRSSGSQSLFLNKAGTSISERSLRRILDQVLVQADISGGVSFRSIRLGGATESAKLRGSAEIASFHSGISKGRIEETLARAKTGSPV